MVLASGIVKALPASKNIFKANHLSVGFQSEQKVLQYLQKNGWQLVFQNLKTVLAEIDLIVQKNEKVVLIEVKKISNPWVVFERVSSKQIERLKLNRNLFAIKFKHKKIQAAVAWIDHKDKISFIKLD